MMVEVNFVDGDKEVFESKKGTEPWKWIPDQEAYLIQTNNGKIIIPAAFVKYLRHVEVDSVVAL